MSWSPCAEFDNGGAIPLRSLQSGPPSRHRKPCNYDDHAAQNDGGQNDRFNVGYHRF
jgi:hypothetical protein